MRDHKRLRVRGVGRKKEKEKKWGDSCEATMNLGERRRKSVLDMNEEVVRTERGVDACHVQRE